MSYEQKLREAAKRINTAIKEGHEVYAVWDGFAVQILSAQHVTKEDGDHLIAFDAGGKEYCIGGAIVQYEVPYDMPNIILWNAGN
jgi:hypothetical protein